MTGPFPMNRSPTPTLIFLPLLKPAKHIPSAWVSFLRDSHLICFHALFRFLLKGYLLRRALLVSPHCLPMDKLTFSLSSLPHFVFLQGSCHHLTSWVERDGDHQISSVQSLSRVQLYATPWLQHARPPCPSPTPGVHSDSSPLSR